MDVDWSYEAWKPTEKFPWTDLPSKSEVENAQKRLQIHARKVADLPYDPEMRLERADILLELCYPELAVSDAYRALILCEAGLGQSEDPKMGELVRIYYGMRLWFENQNLDTTAVAIQSLMSNKLEDIQRRCYTVLVLALARVCAWPDVIEFCEKALKKYPQDILGSTILILLLARAKRQRQVTLDLGQSEIKAKGLTEEDFTIGKVDSKIYPWLPIGMRTRNSELILEANEVLRSFSNSLEIRKSSIGSTGTENQSFGVFAKRRIRASEKILHAPSALGVSTGQNAGYCYNCSMSLYSVISKAFSCCLNVRYCSQKCLEIADSNYHKVLCGKSFDDIYRGGKSRINLEHRLMLRLLAVLVQTGKHPLETSFVRWMLPQDSGYGVDFTLGINVVMPIRILQRLGANIFDPKYDSWVLQTVWNRVLNNRQLEIELQPKLTYLNSIVSFFNHSCSPNVVTSGEGWTTSTAILHAVRDIEKGEELFTTYGPTMIFPREVRSEMLKPWMGEGGCKCKECTK